MVEFSVKNICMPFNHSFLGPKLSRSIAELKFHSWKYNYIVVVVVCLLWHYSAAYCIQRLSPEPKRPWIEALGDWAPFGIII